MKINQIIDLNNNDHVYQDSITIISSSYLITIINYIKSYIYQLINFIKIKNTKKINRDINYVSNAYNDAYSLDNLSWIKQRFDRKKQFIWDKHKFYGNGWLMYNIHNHLISDFICKSDINSVLEVGSGRGNNVIWQALSNNKINIQGLEYSEHGTNRSNEFVKKIPDEFFEMIPNLSHKNANKIMNRVSFKCANAFQMPYDDNSFDMSYTILVFEQMPHEYMKAALEMVRVTKKYCIFIEPFREANSRLQIESYLKKMDYFRFTYKFIDQMGLSPISFNTDYPQKQKYGTGMLITKKNNS